MVTKVGWCFRLYSFDLILTIDEMYRTFNCGIGMVLLLSKEAAKSVTEQLKSQGEQVFQIGHVVQRSGEAVVFK